ncbi:FadR family transcriptional regulator [Martelella lutilitoris]|uniref:FadR family transcriptional regulator n=1 Tax=Martelella lutilitoris TaxID=2583532 RepID=A0A5C4JMD4_9HYPH|nr:FadR/GntR family transcriptional regulator [Martelella lutilitoris]TNB46351.1 FadR family transcriptional regulator [Martelella lutilitoris]
MLNKTLLPQSVARQLQTMIQSGELKDGEKIPSQRELSLKFGVSRPSLREALLTLETLGLVKTEPGRGTFVTKSGSPQARDTGNWRYADSYSVFDVFQTRVMLEGEIARLSAGRLTHYQFDLMEQATAAMEESWARQDLIANVEADLAFHGIIVSACSNAMLRDLYEAVRDKLTETQRQPIPRTDPERMKASVGEHRTIVAALRAGDSEAAGAAMQAHIRNTAQCAGLAP